METVPGELHVVDGSRSVPEPGLCAAIAAGVPGEGLLAADPHVDQAGREVHARPGLHSAFVAAPSDCDDAATGRDLALSDRIGVLRALLGDANPPPAKLLESQPMGVHGSCLHAPDLAAWHHPCR